MAKNRKQRQRGRYQRMMAENGPKIVAWIAENDLRPGDRVLMPRGKTYANPIEALADAKIERQAPKEEA